jgi:hypothetical protein
MCQRSFGGRPTGFESGCFDRSMDPQHTRVFADPPLERRLRAWRRDRALELAELQAESAAAPDGVAAQLEALGYTHGLEEAEEGEK